MTKNNISAVFNDSGAALCLRTHLTWRMDDEAQCCIQLCAHVEEVKAALLAARAVKMALLKTRQNRSQQNRSGHRQGHTVTVRTNALFPNTSAC